MKAGIVLTVSIAMLVRRLPISALVARAGFAIVKAVKRQLILKHAVAVVQ
jgi:ribosomal protein S4